MNRTSAISLLFVPFWFACSSAADRTGPGSGVDAHSAGQGGSPSVAGGSSGGALGNAGSGNALNVGPGTSPDAGVMNGECARQNFQLTRQPAEILLLLDRSGSMKEKPSGSSGSETKWSLVVPAVNEVITATNTSISWGLKAFPEGEGEECISESVTDAVPVSIAPDNAAAVTAHVTALTPEGNGTPTGDAVKAAVKYLESLTDPNPKFILLATDGEPSCAGTSEGGTNARTYAVQAVADAASAGIKTVVVGVATTKSSATQALNEMAIAGQMPQISSDPSAPKYYLASTQDELVRALVEITGQVSNCIFQLTSKPPDPDNIAVEIDDKKAPRDTNHDNGWDYIGSDYLQVEVFGSWCEGLKSASANSVNFVLGCPGEVIQ